MFANETAKTSTAAGSTKCYRVCARCVMDTTDPMIRFNEQGICSHCHYFDEIIKPNWWPNQQGELMLECMLEKVKSHGKGRRYDCIVGVSGGVDSSYLTTKIVERGLRPLMVHVDAGWNSELAVKNIEQLINKLRLDLITHVVNWEEMRDLQLAFLRSNVANQDVPQDHAFFAALYNFAVKENIKYVISGSNYATESLLPQAWGYDAMDVKHLEAIHRQFGTKPLKTFPRVSFFEFYIYYPRVLKMQVLAPLNYMPYRRSVAIETLERDYGWRYYGGKHYESRWTRFFQAHYLPVKFGYDKRKAHLSSLIVAGEITRNEALEELKVPLYDERELASDKLFVAKKLGVTVEELQALIDSPPRDYSEFPNNEARKLMAMKTLRTCRSLAKGLSQFLGR